MKRYRGILFDLCGTVMPYRTDRMPTAEIGGRRVLTTTPLLYPLYQALDGEAVSFARFHDAFIAATEEIARLRERDGREIPSDVRFRHFLARLGVDTHPEAETLRRRLMAVHLARVAECLEFPPAHREVLRRWKRRYRTGLVTNFDSAETVRRVLAREGIADCFDAVFISAEIGIRKPRPEIFLAASRRLCLAPDTLLFVGDSWESDILGAKSVGMDAAWIREEGTSPPEGGVQADYLIEDLPGLGPLLEDTSDTARIETDA